MMKMGERQSFPLRLFVVAGVLLATILATFAAVSVLGAPPAAAAAELPAADETEPPDTAMPAGTIIETENWVIRTGAILWDQTSAVLEQVPLNADPSEWNKVSWALLPVTVESKRDISASMAGLDIRVHAGGVHSSRDVTETFYPSQLVPDALDTVTFAPRERRTGNVGWILPTAAQQAEDCSLEVVVTTRVLPTVTETFRVACA